MRFRIKKQKEVHNINYRNIPLYPVKGNKSSRKENDMYKNIKNSAPSGNYPEKYRRTDLAAECYPITEKEKEKAKQADNDGLVYSSEQKNGIEIVRLDVTNTDGEKKLGKERGSYITVNIGRIWQKSSEEQSRIADLLTEELRVLLNKSLEKEAAENPSNSRKTPKSSSNPENTSSDIAKHDGCALIVGLGNRKITADALGPLCTDGINVTRHVRIADRTLFEKLGADEIAAIAPGVAGQTGIETSDLIKSIVKSISPYVIIAIDALAARSIDRLGTTVQLCDAGISPGSGIGNLRGAVNRETMGVPVIAIGVPTIVDSSTLVCDALEKAGMSEIPHKLEAVLENGKSFFVSLKESDEAVNALSKLLSDSIGGVFGTRFD